MTAIALWENGIDKEMTALLEFSSGATASFRIGFSTAFYTLWQIHGTQKRLVIPRPWSPEECASFEVWNGSELEEKRTFPKVDQIVEMIERFSLKILGSGVDLPNLQEALDLSRVIDALYESARTQRKVSL